jgi:hypothetical protein
MKINRIPSIEPSQRLAAGDGCRKRIGARGMSGQPDPMMRQIQVNFAVLYLPVLLAAYFAEIESLGRLWINLHPAKRISHFLFCLAP